MPDFLFLEAFKAWGSPTTWLEIVAFFLALAMVLCNIREIHWGWPLAVISSVLYFALFWKSKLYGDASLQIFFAVMGLWGWLQWLRGAASVVHTEGKALKVRSLDRNMLLSCMVASIVLFGAVGYFLAHYTDTDVPWWDAFPTALSIVGTFLLGRKYIENWLVWILVNVVSVGLYLYKGLWLTVILYTLFIALSVQGWHVWKKQINH